MAAREYRAYFDESGIHTRRGWCVVAGFVGTVKQWERYEKIWGPYANAPGFHAQPFFARDEHGNRIKKPYAGWSKNKADRYYRELRKAIQVAEVDPIVSAIHLDAFWSFPPEERDRITAAPMGEEQFRLTGASNRPYYLPFTDVMIAAAARPPEEPNVGVYFVFDENKQLERRALRVYEHVKERAKEIRPALADRMKGIVFQSDQDNIGLQAADLIAYAWFQAYSRGSRIREELRSTLGVLLHRPAGDLVSEWPKERMEEILALAEGM